ncbi:MAG: hypothetical protein V3R80_11810, partial [Candidatus Tectomicrobia bacterium]
ETDTAFLDRHFAAWQPMAPLTADIFAVVGLGETLQRRGQLTDTSVSTAEATPHADRTTPWQRYDSWRLGDA